MRQHVSIAPLAARIASRQVSVERVIDDTLARIADLNPTLNAYITVLGGRAREDARRLDAELERGQSRGPLHGIPVSVKDLVDVEGTPTTAASRVREGHLARADAPVVARLRAAGAVIIGKTNLHEFAYGTTSEDSAYGAVRNACDPERSAGGSSGGSATAIAAGLCAGSIGTDTGGSIRIPSAACGVVGLKATYGEISDEGVVALARSLDHVGPMAADVESVRILYEALVGPPASIAATPAHAQTNGALAALTVGIPRRYFLDVLHADVRAHFESVVERLRRAGATVIDVEIPHADLIASVYLHIQLPESSAYHTKSLEHQPELYSPAIRLRLEMGRYVLAEDYVRALRGREVLQGEVDSALSAVDVLALPTLAIPAPALGQATVRVEHSDSHPAPSASRDTRSVEMPVRAVMLRLTQLFDITGHPAITLPMGSTDRSLPTGLQLVGRRHETARLLRQTQDIERLLRL